MEKIVLFLFLPYQKHQSLILTNFFEMLHQNNFKHYKNGKGPAVTEPYRLFKVIFIEHQQTPVLEALPQD
jgi:hypothetical protein